MCRNWIYAHFRKGAETREPMAYRLWRMFALVDQCSALCAFSVVGTLARRIWVGLWPFLILRQSSRCPQFSAATHLISGPNHTKRIGGIPGEVTHDRVLI